MAHFVKWRGPYTDEGSPSIGNTIQKTEVGQAFRFGVWGMVPGLTVGPNDASCAQVVQRDAVESSSNNITWFEMVGLRECHVLVFARYEPMGMNWDMFQLAVDKRSTKVRPPVRGVQFDYQLDKKGIGPNWNASMILTLRVGLVPVNGASGAQINDFNGTSWKVKPWTNKAWNN